MGRRLTSTERLDREMQKMRDMGITIHVTPAGADPEGIAQRPSGIIADAARRAGIYDDE